MGAWTMDVRTRTLLSFDESSAGVQGVVVLDCLGPDNLYELFMGGVWQLIVQQTNIHGKQMDTRWKNAGTEKMKRFLALCTQVTNNVCLFQTKVYLPTIRNNLQPTTFRVLETAEERGRCTACTER
ncbi:hypothetical protein KIN20_003029 [Parelaphostrongylus tenuis]|uniref:Uncharacterized protein n=1 Tax=Parelaphostrongylus tenuis TaxID=148309 RepID=A0AAD5MPB9_PARTN|nr:hypothetical protein KIN20_003029 [Parelaphostrongylus tenuis]